MNNEFILLVVFLSLEVLGLFYIDIHVMAPEERNIVVINKTTEITPYGTEYLILGDDGVVYRTDEWKIYHSMEIDKKYIISVKPSLSHEKYWIEKVRGVL